MLYVLYYALGVLAWYGQTTFSNPTTYDQRQTGDVNVQIHLKDVQVVALLDSELFDGYTDYDYSYDYADFTIKPIVKPTSSPISTSSVKPWNTWPTNPPTSTTDSGWSIEDNSSTSKNTEEPAATTISSIIGSQEESNSTAKPLEIQSANNETVVKLRINDKAGNELLKDSTANKNEEEDEDSIAPTTEANSKKQCPAGFVLSKKGRCRAIQSRTRISLVPLMKLRSKLNPKGRFPETKDLPIRVYKSEDRE